MWHDAFVFRVVFRVDCAQEGTEAQAFCERDFDLSVGKVDSGLPLLVRLFASVADVVERNVFRPLHKYVLECE